MYLLTFEIQALLPKRFNSCFFLIYFFFFFSFLRVIVGKHQTGIAGCHNSQLKGTDWEVKFWWNFVLKWFLAVLTFWSVYPCKPPAQVVTFVINDLIGCLSSFFKLELLSFYFSWSMRWFLGVFFAAVFYSSFPPNRPTRERSSVELFPCQRQIQPSQVQSWKSTQSVRGYS